MDGKNRGAIMIKEPIQLILTKVFGGFFSTNMWAGFTFIFIQCLNNNTDVIANNFPVEYRDLIGYAVGALIWFLRWITHKSVEEKIPEIFRGKPKKLSPVDKALAEDANDQGLV